MRRFIAIVLMLLLPIQSAWALVAMPCRGHVMPQPALVAAGMVPAAHAGHHGTLADSARHAGDHAHHDAAGAGHAHHGGHAAVPDDRPALDDGLAAAGADPCSGSAACMSLHSPPLAQAVSGLPVLKLPNLQPRGDGPRFSSVPPARLQRPPIGLPA